MIPVKDALVDTDTLPGEEIDFGIGDPRWVMRTQAALYSDITTAIIREYSTNAYDANVMANNPVPIRVTLPSVLNPFFIVEDDGVGMDMEVFKKTYTQFGISDKRESNSTNGMLGYGSKSGVAYTTQFKVTSVRNGRRIDAIVKRKPDWRIVLKVVSVVDTDRPNGTRIEIPVHNIDEFNQKATDFYKYWLPGRVLVNGVEPVQRVGEKIADNFYHSVEFNRSYIVMGNVPYRVNNPEALFRSTQMKRINFVAYVDNGDVEFTPSREDLKYSDHTKASLQRIISDFEGKILAKAKADIEKAESHVEAYKAWRRWTMTLGESLFSALEFKGERFEPDFAIRGSRYSPNRYNGTSVRSIGRWGVAESDQTMYITDFEVGLSSRHKQMVKVYAQQQGKKFSYYVFTKQSADEITCKWISKENFVTWETVKAAQPKAAPKARAPRSGRLSGSWDIITHDRVGLGEPLPNDLTDVYWISVSESKVISVPEILSRLKNTSARVVRVPANRVNKFCRDFPEIKPFRAWAKSQVVLDANSFFPAAVKSVTNVSSLTRTVLKGLDMSRIDDKEVVAAAKALDSVVDAKQRYQENYLLIRAMRLHAEYKDLVSVPQYDILDKYPLLNGSILLIAKGPTEHIYTYINAVYAQTQKEKKND